MLALLAPGTSVAGVFTRSATRSAPVLDCQAKLGNASDAGAAILVNSGNSNAFTGHYGQTSVSELTLAVSQITGCPQERVFTASTGVIGEPLPHDRIVAKLDDLNANLASDAIDKAARAIMTTDTFAKGASRQLSVDGKTVSIAGIAKGSGMIAPDMATMLVYIFTDGAIPQEKLQGLVSKHSDSTFNCITVDSDTSTSDSLMMCATGASGVDVSGNEGFATALHEVMLDLAHQVVRDGEGATKFVEIRVTGAASDADAKTHGLSIANSPLVKTAIAGCDPNWGRILAAAGRAGVAMNPGAASLKIGTVPVLRSGEPNPDQRWESKASAAMKKPEYPMILDLGQGSGRARYLACDLSKEYVRINADYRS